MYNVPQKAMHKLKRSGGVHRTSSSFYALEKVYVKETKNTEDMRDPRNTDDTGRRVSSGLLNVSDPIPSKGIGLRTV